MKDCEFEKQKLHRYILRLKEWFRKEIKSLENFPLEARTYKRISLLVSV